MKTMYTLWLRPLVYFSRCEWVHDNFCDKRRSRNSFFFRKGLKNSSSGVCPRTMDGLTSWVIPICNSISPCVSDLYRYAVVFLAAAKQIKCILKMFYDNVKKLYVNAHKELIYWAYSICTGMSGFSPVISSMYGQGQIIVIMIRSYYYDG